MKSETRIVETALGTALGSGGSCGALPERLIWRGRGARLRAEPGPGSGNPRGAGSVSFWGHTERRDGDLRGDPIPPEGRTVATFPATKGDAAVKRPVCRSGGTGDPRETGAENTKPISLPPRHPPPPGSLSKDRLINSPGSPRQSPGPLRSAAVLQSLRLQPGARRRRRRRKGSAPAALVTSTAVTVLLSEAAGMEPTARSPGAGFSWGVRRNVQIRGLPVSINNFQHTVNQSRRQASRPGA
ncbi:uncharacterized protein LOC134418943 [Melospiza melodia melodia]|uniref:uncharacterized protein LOC134418943 n=1 Tax=Melospiza melodia melodia TaxID=1914991 RepID=UPI002FD67146